MRENVYKSREIQEKPNRRKEMYLEENIVSHFYFPGGTWEVLSVDVAWTSQASSYAHFPEVAQ